MKTFLKIIGILALLAALALGGLVLYVKTKYPPEKIKALAVAEAEKALHREVRLDRVHIGLTRGLALSGFAVSERPNFQAGTFLSSAALEVKPYLLPLLKGSLLVKSVSLIEPSVRIERRADGSFNFSDLVSTAAAAPAAAGGAAGAAAATGGLRVFVNHLMIDKGSVNFIDKTPAALNLLVKDLGLTLDNVSLTAPFGVSLTAQLIGTVKDKPVQADVALRGKLSLAKGGSADISSFNVNAGKTALSLRGAVKNFSDPDADLTLAMKPFDASTLAPFVDLPKQAADAKASGEIHVAGNLKKADLQGALKVAVAGVETGLTLKAGIQDPAGDARFNAEIGFSDVKTEEGLLPGGLTVAGPWKGVLKVQGTPLDIHAELDLDAGKASISYDGLFSKPTGVDFQLNARGGVKNQSDVSVENLSVLLDGMALKAERAGAGPVKPGALSLNVESKNLDLGKLAGLVPLLNDYKPAGQVSLTARVEGPPAAPLVKGALTLKSAAFSPVEGLALTQMDGTAAFTQDSADLPQLTGKALGSDFKVKAKIAHFSRPEIQCDADLAQLDAEALLKIFSATAPAAGPAPAAAPPSRGPAPIAKAKGAFRIGAVTHPHYLGKKFQLTWDVTDLGPDLRPLSGAAAFSAADGKIQNVPLASEINKLLKRDASEISYTAISGHFAIKKGRLSTSDFILDSAQADITAKGRVDMVTLDSDLRVSLKLPPGAVGGAGEWFAGTDGRATLDLIVNGPLNDPKIRVDVSRAAAHAAKNFIQKGLQTLGTPITGKSNPENGQKGNPAVNDALEQGQKLFNNIFKKKK